MLNYRAGIVPIPPNWIFEPPFRREASEAGKLKYKADYESYKQVKDNGNRLIRMWEAVRFRLGSNTDTQSALVTLAPTAFYGFSGLVKRRSERECWPMSVENVRMAHKSHGNHPLFPKTGRFLVHAALHKLFNKLPEYNHHDLAAIFHQYGYIPQELTLEVGKSNKANDWLLD